MNTPEQQAAAVHALRNASAEQLEELLSVLAAAGPRAAAPPVATSAGRGKSRVSAHAAANTLAAPSYPPADE